MYRVLALLIAVLTGVAPAVADPLDAAPVLTVTGDRAGTATFTLDAPASLRFADAVVTGSGRYAGLELFATSGRWYGGLLTVPELDQPPRPMAARTPTTFRGGVVSLPAGRYRVYLLSDAAAEIRLPLKSGTGRTVRTTAAITPRFHVANAPVETGRTSLALRRPVTTTARTRSFVVGQYGPGLLTGDLRLRACLTRRGTACGAHNGVTSNGAAMVATQVGLGDSSPLRGQVDARVEAVVPSDARAAWLSFAVVQYERV